MNSRLPAPFHGGAAGAGGVATSNIPAPVHRSSIPIGGSPLKCTSASSSRSTSPSHSFIPTPRTRVPLNDKHISSGHNVSRTTGGVSSPYSNKSSTIDKLKLYNPSDKNKVALGSTKRTSSSSGFSSARSERSDSSTSLYNDAKSTIPEKKEPVQNELSLKSGLKKKVIKIPGETKVARTQSRTSVTKLIQPSSVTVRTVSEKPATIPEAPADDNRQTPAQESAEEKLTSEKMGEEGVKPVAGANGAGEAPKGGVVAGAGGSGIPKPTLAVKGMTKPTHTVAPMPQVPQPDNKTADPVAEKLVVNCNGHAKQPSLGEDEEATEVVKPMQPLLRGYKPSHNIAITARPPVDPNGWRATSQPPDSNRAPADGDYYATFNSSGYVSDGDLLSRTKPDINDGYISEGGAVLYAQRIQRDQQNLSVDPTRGAKPSPRPQRELKGGRVVSDEIKILSSEQVHHFKRGSGQGPGGGGRGGGQPEPPLSPPEPTPVVYRVVGSRSHVKKADSSQQTENSAFRQVSSSQWKKYMDGMGGGGGGSAAMGRVPELSRHKTDLDMSVSRKPSHKQPTHNGLQRKTDKKRITGSKEELVPEEFTNGDRKGRENKSKVRGVPPNFGYIKRSMNGNGKGEPRTAQVSAVPRTKVKVSGGTQTDLKSYSVGGTSGAQLSASVRERLMQGSQSLPKPRTDTGSLSDSNYTELSPYSAMYRHTTAYTSSLPARATAGGLIEADSIESLPAQLHHRASLTHPRLMSSPSPSPSPTAANRLSRSNSISYLRERTFPRSTKSEKLYPSMLQRSEEMDPYYSVPYSLGPHSSQPTSPTPSQMSQGTLSRFNYPISPISASPSSHMINRNYPYSGLMNKMGSKDDDVHGSAVSLVSTASSLYSTPEEKQAHELRKLRRELGDAQEKVHTLTSQLSTNAHVVSAFEQSLSNMTQRLQQLTASAEKKDCELQELRQTIELLRKQSVEAGLTSGHVSPPLTRRHTINNAADNNSTDAAGSNISRQLSTDSVSSLNSLSSACSLSNHTEGDKKKKRGWLRSSFNKAFSRGKKSRAGSVSDVEDGRGASDMSAPSSPLLGHPHHTNGDDHGAVDHNLPYERDTVVEELKKQLREKDLVLTDIRLEALSSAHQLESLKDTVIKMRNEMLNLKQDNERLQRIVTSKSLTSSQSSLPLNEVERRYSMGDAITSSEDRTLMDDPDGKRVLVSVYLGSHGSYHKYVEKAPQCPIATLSVSGNTKWEMLDAMVRRAFKEYCERIDPLGSLGGLGVDCIWSYHIGEVVRYKDSNLPDLLPCGYLVGETCNISVCLKGALHNGSVDALVFQTLIPKSIVQRYVSLLSDHRRIILCGPSGTGKTYLANKLAEYLVLRQGKDSMAEAIATFNVDHKSSKELRGYLAHVAEQCELDASELPSVIILDNLQHAASLGEVFNGLLTTKHQACPYIIGTMNQATCATTNLQLHHNFRWVLCANHMEPVRGLLGRCLARRLVEAECRAGTRDSDLVRVVEWLPRVWHHLNQFLETHSSSDVTIGPRLFLTCPMDTDGSQVWFTDLWNYSVVPYLLEAVREGLQLYGCRAPWDDPTSYICQTYPWISDAVQGGSEALIRLRPEDVGYDTPDRDIVGIGSSAKSLSSNQSDNEADPLLNMLMRLQEAANYPSPPDNASNGTGVESTL
ncbi:protein sickie isoform X2 [Macrosteles quadrilineatus]|uniref:protein sickie isoform X2 n=1 Tax=Macrosteles quadrilineatus TaxID=74068 RepID=UPI0023E12675|nr:protein sickie isoform X2 [Macrosteles quadrilineatus]